MISIQANLKVLLSPELAFTLSGLPQYTEHGNALF